MGAFSTLRRNATPLYDIFSLQMECMPHSHTLLDRAWQVILVRSHGAAPRVGWPNRLQGEVAVVGPITYLPILPQLCVHGYFSPSRGGGWKSCRNHCNFPGRKLEQAVFRLLCGT